MQRQRWFFRHPALIRICHWVNVLCLSILLMSGLQIFNAHPALYWGKVSTFDKPFVSLEANTDAAPTKGFTKIAGHSFDTTGVLGLSTDSSGQATDRGFPRWITLPADQDLATGRRWHFFFAWIFVFNGLVYLAYAVATGQFRARFIPTGFQVRHIWDSVKEHIQLRFPEGEDAKRYNVIQKIDLFRGRRGPASCPGPGWADHVSGRGQCRALALVLFGGRQSARTIHFIIAGLLVAFVLVHVALVVLSGPWNNMRGMITGWFAIDRPKRAVPSHD